MTLWLKKGVGGWRWGRGGTPSFPAHPLPQSAKTQKTLKGSEMQSEAISEAFSRKRVSRVDRVSQTWTQGYCCKSTLYYKRSSRTFRISTANTLQCNAEVYGQIHYLTKGDNSTWFAQDSPSMKTGSCMFREPHLCQQRGTGTVTYSTLHIMLYKITPAFNWPHSEVTQTTAIQERMNSPYWTLWPPDAKNWLIGKDPDDGKDWRQEEKGATEDEMVGWHHWRNGHEFE